MRLPNGYGSVKKLSGKRRRPYRVMITAGWETTDDGKVRQIQKTIGYYATKAEGLKALAEYHNNPYDLDSRTITFAEIYEKAIGYKLDSMKENTRRSYISAYKHMTTLHNMRMVDIRKTHYQSLIDNMTDYSLSAQASVIKIFHAVDKYALENDVIQKGYSQFVTRNSNKDRQVKLPFTAEEVELIRKNTTNDTSGVLILLYTGLRINEMLHLRIDQVHLNERYLDVQGTKNKSSIRIVPIHTVLLPIFENLCKGGNTYLFEHDGKPMSYYRFNTNYFEPIMKSIGASHKHHECRHTFATFARTSKLDPFYIKKILGHTSQDITEDVYTHTLLDELISNIDRFKITKTDE